MTVLTYVRSWQEHPSHVTVAWWILDLVITEINPNFMFSALAFCVLQVTGINLPLERNAWLPYSISGQRQRRMADIARPQWPEKAPTVITWEETLPCGFSVVSARLIFSPAGITILPYLLSFKNSKLEALLSDKSAEKQLKPKGILKGKSFVT